MKLPIKKILILIGFLAVVLVLGYLLYYFFFGPAVGPTPPYIPKEAELKPGELPKIVNANVRLPEAVNVNAALPDIGLIPGEPSRVARGGLTRVQKLTDRPAKGTTVAPDGS